ncbi:MAG: hypothetical protein K2G32_08345, partial [Oscillospiraceae bacterium]|nr:hypothetical protein [Oscillospiraceae bacterium]
MIKSTSKWIPLLVTLAISAATLVMYSIVSGEITVRMYPQIIAVAFVPGILPLIGKVTKREFPIFPNVLISLHIVLANNLGSALGFYDRIKVWDLIMHGYFGFVFSVVIY